MNLIRDEQKIEVFINFPPNTLLEVKKGDEVSEDTVIATAPQSIKFKCIDFSKYLDAAGKYEIGKINRKKNDEIINEEDTLFEIPLFFNLGKKHIKAGKSGIVKHISENTGLIFLADFSNRQVLKAKIRGSVIKVSMYGITIETSGTVLPAVACVGEFVSAPVIYYNKGMKRDRLKNRIVIVEDTVWKTDIDFFKNAAAAGIICAGISASRIIDMASRTTDKTSPEITIAVIEGFGKRKMCKEFQVFFRNLENCRAGIIPGKFADFGRGRVLFYES